MRNGLFGAGFPLGAATAATETRNALEQGYSTAMRQPGLLGWGNIDLTKRPRVQNRDGSVSTVRSMGINVDGVEYVIPTVSDDGRIMSDNEAIQTFYRTGRHLGAFKTPQQSDAYANALHVDQERMYAGRPNPNAPRLPQRRR